MLVRCIDFETTGMPDIEGAAICEVGWCDIEVGETTDVSGRILAKIGTPVSMFCNPGQPMPPEARAVHHISDKDVIAGVLPAEGIRRLAEGAPSYFVAHNAKFEQAFFPDAVSPWICTYKAALRFWPDAPAYSNQVLRYWLELVLGDEAIAMPPHRAGPDAYVTAHLFARMLADGRATIEDMARWSSGPALLPKVPFGKHRNARWEDVPTDYLEWIANKSDMDGDIKANARHHLKNRGEE